MTNRPTASGDGPGHDHSACLHMKEEAAVALLQHREPAPDVLAHLEACPPCQDEYVELAVLPRLLGATRDSLGATPPEPPRAQLLDRLLAEVSRRRRRRRLTVTLLAAAATIAVVAAVTLLSLGRTVFGPDSAVTAGGVPASSPAGRIPASSSAAGEPHLTRVSPTGPLVATGAGSDPASGANAQVDVRAEGVGSAVSVSVHGWPQGKPCRMIVHDSGGQAREVGIWTVDASDQGSYVEEVDLPPASIERIELVDDRTGRPMIDVRVRKV